MTKSQVEDNFCDIQCKLNCLYQHNSRIRKLKLCKILLVFIGIFIAVFYFSKENKLAKKEQCLLKINLPQSLILKNISFGITTYSWFMGKLKFFHSYGETDEPKYAKDTPVCSLNLSTLGPRVINKSTVNFEWLDKQFPEVKSGGFHAPEHCRARHRVAVLIPFRNRSINLAILINHLHPFLQKQLLAYRIFVIEQVGNDSFNKGTLYNIGFLESQRFGSGWQCYVFHDVDLLPMDERILYSCPRKPTHMSPAVESHGYELPYTKLFGGVTSMTKQQFELVNGYSNLYWNWGAEDDDMFVRLQAKRLPMLRYNRSIARYAALPHKPNQVNDKRYAALYSAKTRFRKEGLRTVRYLLVGVIKRRLFTHILADVNPDKYLNNTKTTQNSINFIKHFYDICHYPIPK